MQITVLQKTNYWSIKDNRGKKSLQIATWANLCDSMCYFMCACLCILVCVCVFVDPYTQTIQLLH